jgi:ornithine carbamoyltransferase
MSCVPPDSVRLDADSLSTQVVTALFERAQRIRAGEQPSSLRGRHVALVVASEGLPSAVVIEEVALALGARASRVRFDGLRGGELPDLAQVCRALAALYDVIGCVGLPVEMVEALARGTGRPVITDVCAPGHPARRVADMMTEASPPGAVGAAGGGGDGPGEAWRLNHRAAVMAQLASRLE